VGFSPTTPKRQQRDPIIYWGPTGGIGLQPAGRGRGEKGESIRAYGIKPVRGLNYPLIARPITEG